ncbi:MAG: bifunctional alpha,alpha-trehalose-phosphate synthase (UDP-forming)/trehalose-phosphatase [Acidobacteriota bacterium]
METLKAFIEGNLSGESLIVVSNREPYIHRKRGQGLRVEIPAGGVTSAIDNVLRVTGGTWVAWGSGSGDWEAVDRMHRVLVPPGNPRYALKRVNLPPKVADNYYHGYANQMMWPLCHIALDRVYFRKRFWEDYRRANDAFASAVLEEANDDAVVWVQDYHLCLLPGMLRERKEGLTIAHFWHIPWPDWSVFRVCPQAREVLEGLLGNDLIGFQIPLFVKNFLGCVKECIGAEVDFNGSTVTYRGHTTRLLAFPISIDYDAFNSMASSQRTTRAMEHLRGKYALKDGRVGIGVDRLEYTKALIKRLQTISLLFEKYEKFRGRFTFLQIAVPTRMKESYISYKKTVEELVAQINRKYTSGSWKPIIYLDTKVEHRDLVAYYRMADVAIVSSVYDGMNLVAKEFIASQIDGKGALVLSELAGAADDLDGSFLINPYDIEGCADTIKRILEMPAEEKAGRMLVLNEHVRKHDIYKWVYDILRELVRVSGEKRTKCRYLLGQLKEMEQRADSLFLFLDYDGTLAPIVESPDRAVITERMRGLLDRLKRKIPVAVISGRGLEDVRAKVGLDDVIYAGNHGAEIWGGEKVVRDGSRDQRHLLGKFIEQLREALSHVPGAMVEDKGVTASLHFRMVKLKQVEEVLHVFRDIVKDYEDRFRITAGKKVFEIRPRDAWNKGDAVTWIMGNYGDGRLPVYIGDDTTDEDAFRVIEGKGISVSIGESPGAEYCLKDQAEVEDFLTWLSSRFS